MILILFTSDYLRKQIISHLTATTRHQFLTIRRINHNYTPAGGNYLPGNLRSIGPDKDETGFIPHPINAIQIFCVRKSL